MYRCLHQVGGCILIEAISLASVRSFTTLHCIEKSQGSIRTVDPELLGPNEGFGHDYPHEFQNVLATEIDFSSRTVSNRVDPPGSLYSPPGGISPIRDPTQKDFRITGYVALPIIVPNGFNRIPEMGKGKGVTQSSFHQHLQSISLQSKTASRISIGIIHRVDPELPWPIKGISDDSPHEFQNGFGTKLAMEMSDQVLHIHFSAEHHYVVARMVKHFVLKEM
ncbi:hypothetical protein CHS0354_028388 [Potamilus streckersoni]|uniref:Uncharacterized protein n=1 Tax=Potamilus streckersoni TaxID=2493646 RepID=A0AAE0RUH9_9BIVA|nr:hypothetical protein CHS0354_028388 [Potamilus streckersoni]